MRDTSLSAIVHQPWLEYRHALPDGQVCIRLCTGRGDWDHVLLHAADMYGEGPSMSRADQYPMERKWRDGLHDYYEAVISRNDPRIHYIFSLTQGGITLVLDQDGLYPAESKKPEDLVCFPFPYAYPERKKPDWARGCVGYQIFPDRFLRGQQENASLEAVEPWDSTRYANEYRFGGNLNGIREAIPYLKELGVGVVYMTPIFQSNTSHRYNTFDYYQVDPLLGSLEDLKGLADELHTAGLRIVLDGVFNHSGTAFAPFQDAKTRGRESPYYDWFFFDENKYPCGYATFAHTPEMPKLNLKNEDAAAYFLAVGRYWLKEAHIDGWRLDVSPEVWPDFWRKFRTAVLQENPDALLIAECWDDSRQWLTPGDMFDSTMHYVLSRAIWQFFGKGQINLSEFDDRVNRAMAMYPHAVQEVLWNFLDSHDTARFLTLADEAEYRLRAASFFQMTHPGVPIIYYGDELGLSGGPDPDCRRPMPWHTVLGNSLLNHYQSLTYLRQDSDALRHGDFTTWLTADDGLYAYLRKSKTQEALMVLNTAEKALRRVLPLPEGFSQLETVKDELSGQVILVTAQTLVISLEPGQGMVFLRELNQDKN